MTVRTESSLHLSAPVAAVDIARDADIRYGCAAPRVCCCCAILADEDEAAAAADLTTAELDAACRINTRVYILSLRGFLRSQKCWRQVPGTVAAPHSRAWKRRRTDTYAFYFLSISQTRSHSTHYNYRSVSLI